MRGLSLLLLLALGALAPASGAADPTPGECAPLQPGPGIRCLYRSGFPSAGLVATCRADQDCRVGYYQGRVDAVTWLAPPPGLVTLPRPAVTWHSATLAQARFAIGARGSVSYFYEARRRRLSAPRPDVLAVDTGRQLIAVAEERRVLVRRMFGGEAVLAIERDWADGASLVEAIALARFDPDGRLTLRWLRGPARDPIDERFSVPTLPRP